MVLSTILSKKTIKPSSATPASLRRHNLSFSDHMATPAYAPMAVLYSKPSENNISQILENSLSKVLVFYYPLAGRLIMDDKCSYVECNDIGAEFLNVRVSCPMSEILNHATDIVYPHDLPWRTLSSFNERSLLVVQLSHFDCGGISISVCISHKIVDAYSISMFLNDWAAITGESDFKPSPQFDANSFFPLMDDPPIYVVPDFLRGQHQPCVSRMYHFSSSSLGRLKDTVSMNSEVQNPTRFEVAIALIHKCGREASKANNSGLFKPSLSCHLMNLRPPLPLNTIGNGVHFFNTIAVTEDEIQVPHFVAQIRKAKQHLRDQLASRSLMEIKLEPEGANIMEREYDFYLCAICVLACATKKSNEEQLNFLG
ncbi:acylsugar acyltransferase 3-like [Lycium barbarum]|uniref:acylsugar acyltransferase 3-like n=1 Tax=Lycium barbarum TaxID=112863 RepID=UPI00293EB5CB|nr:acylsugar acyltransferase 3-like [Lycium barbarum]